MLNKYKFRTGLLERTKEIFWDNQLIISDEEMKKIHKQIDYLTSGVQDYFDITDLEIESENYYIFILLNKYSNIEERLTAIWKDIEDKIEAYKKIEMYFINELYEDELKIKNILKKNTYFPHKNVEISYLNVNNINDKEYCIKIDSRIRSLETKLETEDKLIVEGHVFIANLNDIVKIFNELGDELFDYNIRMGIEDKLGVGEEITRTIKQNPAEFWFLNNGITMLVQDDDFRIKKTKSLLLKYGENKRISIINGAQTITTAADVYLDSEINLKEIESAKVMLRVMHLKEPKSEQEHTSLREIATRISVSLNRQKPIEPEDLAYTTEFVYNINKLWESNKHDTNTFNLVRRSKSTIRNGVILEEFVRAAIAYLDQKPGQARSGSRANLLNIESKDGSYLFTNKIFKTEFIDKKKCTLSNLYKYYKPINFAIFIADYYQRNAARLKYGINNKKQLAVISYGKWFFVAYIIYILNNENNDDYSKFAGAFIDNKRIDECIIMFSDLYKDMFNDGKDTIDSNEFKNQKVYTEFKNGNVKDSNKLKSLNDKIIENFTCNELEVSEVAATINNECI